ncbi:MAG: hypothetical protein ABIL09_19665 [Gemmatimonadota bacterium]
MSRGRPNDIWADLQAQGLCSPQEASRWRLGHAIPRAQRLIAFSHYGFEFHFRGGKLEMTRPPKPARVEVHGG